MPSASGYPILAGPLSYPAPPPNSAISVEWAALFLLLDAHCNALNYFWAHACQRSTVTCPPAKPSLGPIRPHSSPVLLSRLVSPGPTRSFPPSTVRPASDGFPFNSEPPRPDKKRIDKLSGLA